jgi:YidC/Oxa1 family membrane protein insertase
MDFLTNPFIVALLWLYQTFGQSLVVAIVIFTILTRVITYPLTATQLKSTKKMQELSPKLAQIREKYKGDREKQAQAQMALYREHGVNPLAGCLPLLIQMPILFGLYGAIYSTLGNTPLQLLDVSHRLLTPELGTMLPLQTQFLWMNLGQPDNLLILPFLVVVTTWLQMKLTMPPPADSKDPSAAMSRNMTTIMPLMIGLFSLSFASGLSIYWVVSNVVGIAQYAMMGRVDLRNLTGRAPVPAAAPAAAVVEPGPEPVRRRRPVTSASNTGESQQRTARSGNTGINRKRKPDAPRAATARRPRTSKAK